MAKNHQDHYKVINLTGIPYDGTPFGNRVETYQWEDHHSPTLSLLFNACESIMDYLNEDDSNVVVIHCNAGKGRTGTLICCYLLFSGFADCAQNAITYYGWKRIRSGKGVTQPSQIRYIFYFEKVLQGKILGPKPLKLTKVLI